jgi:hypothetical protein
MIVANRPSDAIGEVPSDITVSAKHYALFLSAIFLFDRAMLERRRIADILWHHGGKVSDSSG